MSTEEDDPRPTVRFTRYEQGVDGELHLQEIDRLPDQWGGTVVVDPGKVTEPFPPMRPGVPWLSEHIYDAARYGTMFSDWPAAPSKPLPWHQRLRVWCYWHLPRMHWGPCAHSECGGW